MTNETTQARPHNRTLVLAVLGVLAILLPVGAWIGWSLVQARQRAEARARFDEQERLREDTQARFAELAANICRSLGPEDAVLISPAAAEIRSLVKQRAECSARLSASCRNLASIAAADLEHEQALQAMLDRQSPVPELLDATARVIAGLASDNTQMRDAGIEAGVGQVKGIAQMLEESKKLSDRLLANRYQIAAAAPKFSGAVEAKPFVRCSFVEKSGFWGNYRNKFHKLTLENASGIDLHDCVVDVRLIGDDGSNYRDVWYLASWPIGARQSTCIDTDLLLDVPSSVEQIELTVWAKEMSSPIKRVTEPPFGW